MLSVHVTEPVPEVTEGHALDSREAGGRYLRGSSFRVVAYAAGLAVGLGSTPLAVHHLGPVAWGQYASVTALMFVVAAITEGGLGQMGVKELSVGDADRRASLLADLLGLRVVLTVTGALVAIGFSLLAGYTRVVVEGTVIAGVGLLLTNVAGTMALSFAAEMRLGWMAVLDFAPQLAIAVTMIFLVLADASLLPFYAASAFAGTTALVVALAGTRASFRPRFLLGRWKALLAQTIIYAAATGTAAIYFRTALLATSVISTKTQTGYYSLALRILELTTAVPWLLVSSAFPILARSAWNDEERLRYAVDRLLHGAIILGGWLALVLVAGAPLVIHVVDLGARSFNPAVGTLRILAGAIPATCVLAVLSYSMLSLHLYKHLVVSNLAVIVLAVVLSGVLVSRLGADGAALTSLVLEITLMGAYLLALARDQRRLLPAPGGFLAVALALAIGFGAATPLLGHPFIAALIGSLALAVALLALRAVPAELVALVRR